MLHLLFGQGEALSQSRGSINQNRLHLRNRMIDGMMVKGNQQSQVTPPTPTESEMAEASGTEKPGQVNMPHSCEDAITLDIPNVMCDMLKSRDFATSYSTTPIYSANHYCCDKVIAFSTDISMITIKRLIWN